MLQDRLGLSERRACRYVGQHRSTQRHVAPVAVDEQALRAELRRISRRRPRWGYRRAHQLLLDEGWQLNRKRTQRLWREEGLRVPQRRRKRQRLGTSTVPAERLRAEAPDHVWALDFQFDQTADGRIVKLLHVVDEFTREALAIECRRRIDADATVAVLERLVAERATAPGFIRCDNGPELTANALRDWCRFSRAGSMYIEPGSPWQNPYVESFGSRARDELLSVELFSKPRCSSPWFRPQGSTASEPPGCSSRRPRREALTRPEAGRHSRFGRPFAVSARAVREARLPERRRCARSRSSSRGSG